MAPQMLFSDLLTTSTADGCVNDRRIEVVLEEVDGNPENGLSSGFHVRLTDPRDPLFLFHCDINHIVFDQIKTQQELLVDYNNFSKMLVDLLQDCKATEMQTKTTLDKRFLLQFSPHNLMVVESNPFKRLVHISLPLRAANDEELKRYLSTCIKKKNDELHTLQSQFRQAERSHATAIDTFTEKLKAADSNNVHLTRKLEDTQRELTASFEDKLRTVETGMRNDKTNTVDRLERRLLESEAAYTKKLRELETRLQQVQQQNRELLERRQKLENNVREWQQQANQLQCDKENLQTQLSDVKCESQKIVTEKFRLEKELEKLAVKYDNINDNLIEKEEKLRQMSDDLLLEQQLKEKLNIEVNKKTQHCTKLGYNIKTLSAEVNKGNDIIKKLQTDLKQTKDKLKLTARVTDEQEKLLKQKQDEIDALVARRSKEEASAGEMAEEIATLEMEKGKLQEKVDELKGVVKSNENVIGWLNKQLNASSGTNNQLIPSGTSSHLLGGHLHGANVPPAANSQPKPRVLADSSQYNVPPRSYLPSSGAIDKPLKVVDESLPIEEKYFMPKKNSTPSDPKDVEQKVGNKPTKSSAAGAANKKSPILSSNYFPVK